MVLLFVLLLAAHCYGDFLLQSDRMVRNKRRITVLLLHGLLHGAVGYGLIQDWRGWQLPLLAGVIHIVIDGVKSRFETSPAVFGWDQAAHVVSLAGLAWLAVEMQWTAGFTGQGWALIVTGAGFAAAVLGAGSFIGLVAGRLIASNPAMSQELKQGLVHGGRTIGRLERALIFVLMMIQQPAGIGFLVAAKSILRFEESKRQHVAEYVLIGTLWSFTLAIALAWLTSWALQLGP